MSLELKDLEHLCGYGDYISPALRQLTEDEKTTWIENKELSTDKVVVYNKFDNIRYLLVYSPIYSVDQVSQVIEQLTKKTFKLQKEYPITYEQMNDIFVGFDDYQFKLIHTAEELNETRKSGDYLKINGYSTPTLFFYIHRRKKFGKIFMNNYSLDQAKKIFNRFLERKQRRVFKPVYKTIENLKKND